MNLDRALQRHRATLGALRGLIPGFSAEAWERSSAPGEWSPAQVYGHIAIIAKGFSFKNLDACLAESGHLGGRKRWPGYMILWLNRLPGARRIKVEFPPELLPIAMSQGEAREAMDALEVRAEAYLSRVAAGDPSRTAKHFLLGWMNAAEWFRFAEIHHRHHLEGQLTRLLAASKGFPHDR